MKHLIQLIEEQRKDIGYDDPEKEEPGIQEETLADFYETKAEAWFAGWDSAIERVVEIIRDNTRGL